MNQQQIWRPAHDDEQQREAAALPLQQHSSVATHKAAAAAALYMDIKLISRLLRRHLDRYRAWVYTGNQIHGTKRKE